MTKGEAVNVEESAGLPLYLRVSATLRTAILRGIYPVGSRLPTEEELRRRFKVSRHTVREALRQLRVDGLIVSRPRSRPVVTPPMLTRSPERIGADMGVDFFDYVIGTRLDLVDMKMAAITDDIAAETGLRQGEQLLRVNGYRVNIDSGRTTCWNSYLIDAQYAVVGRLLARHVGPLIPLLEDLFGKRITRIARSISAIGMPAKHAGRLEVEPGSATLAIVTRCETADGRIAMVNRSLHPGAALRYTIDR